MYIFCTDYYYYFLQLSAKALTMSHYDVAMSRLCWVKYLTQDGLFYGCTIT